MDEFKSVEQVLNIDGIPEKENVIKLEKKEVVSSDDHTKDIKADYNKIREEIVNNLDTTEKVIDKVSDNILDPNNEDDKYLARKAEVLAGLIRVGIELRKELMDLHQSKKKLLEEEKVQSKEQNKGLTTAEIKELLTTGKKQIF